MTLRNPSVAGQFYPAVRADLEKELAQLVDMGTAKVDCLGAVSPHAGYMYSGMVAGKVLSMIKFKDSFIILGPNHTGSGSPFSIQASGSWRMPMGDVCIDEELAQAIKSGDRSIKEDMAAHMYEHSIEVQLPFLQYQKKDISFVPIVIAAAEKEALKDLGVKLADSVKKSGKEVVIIASSDMTHYESRESAGKKDRIAIDAILKLDEDKLAEAIEAWDISMCGYAPTIVMLAALKSLGAKKARLIEYKTSGDTTGDYSSVVGYAGIIIT